MSNKIIPVSPRAKRTARPKGLKLRGNIWWVDKMVAGKSYRFSTKKTDIREACAVLELFMRERVCEVPDDKEQSIPQSSLWALYVSEMVDKPGSWFWRSLSEFDKRTKKRNFYDEPMTEGELVHLLLDSQGRCTLTGIPFDFGLGSENSPYRCSIDRIDSSAGYTKRNCRAVCLCVNYALNKYGEGVLLRVAQGYLLKKIDADEKDRNVAEASVVPAELAGRARAKRKPKRSARG